MMGKDKPCQRVIFVALGQVEVVLLVDKVNFATRRKDIVTIIYLADNQLFLVVLILYIPKDLFHEVFHRYDTCHAAQLIYHNGYGLLPLHQLLHQLMPKDALGHKKSLLHALLPIIPSKHL